MKRFGEIIVFVLKRITKVFGNTLARIAGWNMKVKSGRVMCWAYNFKQYGCNPRYLTDYILEHDTNFEIYWVFRKGIDTSKVDKRVKVIKFPSWEYYKLLATAEFLITNSRTEPFQIYWHKRPEQKYLMLWHGGVALKKVEGDAQDKLGYQYLHKAKTDSRIADLMISGCSMQSKLLRKAFWYEGEIMECGIPRNDIFFHSEYHAEFKKRIYETYNIALDSHLVLYAPTFRRNKSIEPYRINWSRMYKALQKMLNVENITILVRLHPNLIGKVDTSSLVAFDNVIDATRYHDMQELLCVADMLITDYSSSMFDFAMLKRPCILYATDVNKYDRGYYFDLKELPFPLAENEENLLHIINNFSKEDYMKSLNTFLTDTIGLYENGNAAQSIMKWMQDKSLRS